MLSKKLIAKSLLFSFLFFSLAFADSAEVENQPSPNRLYQVELIIYSQLSEEALQSEEWPFVENKISLPASTIEFQNPSFTASASYSLLSPRNFKLSAEANQLKKDPHYKVLLHMAWQQPMIAGKTMPPIHFMGGTAFDDRGNPLSLTSQEDFQNENLRWQVNGMLTLAMRHYFDLHFNILFTEPASQITRFVSEGNLQNIEGDLAYFRVIQDRRTKSQELNYIDSPLYGILVEIFPVK